MRMLRWQLAYLSGDKTFNGISQHDGDSKQEAPYIHHIVFVAIILEHITLTEKIKKNCPLDERYIYMNETHSV